MKVIAATGKNTGPAGSGQVTEKPQTADRNRPLNSHEVQIHAGAASSANQRKQQQPKTGKKPAPAPADNRAAERALQQTSSSPKRQKDSPEMLYTNVDSPSAKYEYENIELHQMPSVSVEL